MAKKQTFGAEAKNLKAAHRKMAKVIIATKSTRSKFAFRETMIDQESVRDFIKENRS